MVEKIFYSGTVILGLPVPYIVIVIVVVALGLFAAIWIGNRRDKRRERERWGEQ